MALTNEDLKAIGSLMDEKLDVRLAPIEQKVGTIEQKLSAIENDIAEIKSDLAETKETVNKHYYMFEEFYVHQSEENTRIWSHLR